SGPQARGLVRGGRGEPIVLAAKAMGLPAEVLQRLLLFWSSWVGQPVDRICELADLYDEISTDAAHRLIAIWREDGRAETEPVQQEPGPRGSGDDLIEKMTPGAVLALEDPRVGIET